MPPSPALYHPPTTHTQTLLSHTSQPCTHTHTLSILAPIFPLPMSLPALPLGLQVGVLGSWLLTQRVVLKSPGLETWCHLYKDLAAAKVSRKQRRIQGSTVRGEDAPKPVKPMLSQRHPCH